MPIRRCDGNNHRGCCRDHVCTHDNCCAGGGEHDVHANDNRDTANHHHPGHVGAHHKRGADYNGALNLCPRDDISAGGKHDVYASDNRDTANHHRPGRIGALQRRDRLWHRHLPDRQQRVPGQCQVAVPHRFTGCRMR